MNTAKSRPLLCSSGRKPRLDSSNSRRSEMAISVGHFMAMSPSSVGKVWTGRPSTLPPPSTPRARANQPYLASGVSTRARCPRVGPPRRGGPGGVHPEVFAVVPAVDELLEVELVDLGELVAVGEPGEDVR